MKKVIQASKEAKARKQQRRMNTMPINDMIDDFENRIDQLETFEDIDLATDVNVEASSTSMEPRYKLCDSRGLPQAGCDEEYFDEWYELEEYLDENPDVQDRISEGYAWIEDLTDSQIEREMDYRKGNIDAL